MREARAFEHPHRSLQKLRVRFQVFAEFTARVAEKKLRVFFVSQAVGRNMIRPEGDRFPQVRFPLFERLSGQPEHQIDAHVVEPGASQNLKRRFRLRRVVLAAE